MQIIIGNSIGVNRTSTLGGGPFEYTAIDNNFSMEFDGVDDYVNIGNGISFNYNDPFTISTWVNVDAVSGTKAIYNKYDSSISGGRGIALNLFSSSGSGLNLIYFDLYSTNSGSTSTRKRITTRSTDFIINPNIWYLLTITYDGSGLGSGIKMYLNGVPKSVTITQDNLQSGDITNSLNAHVGATTTPSLFFNGTIDEVAVWDSALSDLQISELYNSGVPATSYTNTPLAWYKLDQSANWEADTSGNWQIPDAVSAYPQSFDFDGSSSYITVPKNITTDFTVSFWIKALGSATYDGILGQGTSSPQGGILRYIAYDGSSLAGNILVFIGSWTNLSGPITTRTWANIVLTYDSTADELKGYNNGSLYTTISNPDFSGQTADAHSFERIGMRNGLTGTVFNGLISNVQQWDTALPATGTDSIETLYNNGTPLTTAIQNANLKAWWKLDDTATFSTNWTIPDASGNGNDGTSSGMTEQSLVNNNVSTLNGESSGMTSGNLVLSDLTRNLPYENYSLNFDSGSSEDIDLGSISTLNNASTYTLSMWVNPSVLSGLQFLFAIVTSTTERLFINLNNAIPNVGMANGTNSTESFNSAPLTVDTWHHLAVVFDGTQTGADRLTFYLNGVAETTTVTTWDSSTPTFASNGFLSNYAQFALYYFSGKISNFSIFSDALSTTEVLKLYANGIPQDLTSFTPQPSHWWTLGKESFWNGSDWIVRDMIGSNDGTSSNMAVSDLVGDAPRSEANGTGTNMDIPTNLVGNAGFSDKNAYSINMSSAARVTDTP